jgi:hypothetical protein
VLFLSGAINRLVLDAMRPDVGFMSTERNGQRPPLAMACAYDNGCFAGSWSPESWATWLMAQPAGLFAVVPDIVGDARRTRLRFEVYAPFVRRYQPVAYALQDGSDTIEPPWDEFDVLFVGGSTGFKLCDATWAACAEARRRGKWVHVGRVNSLKRLRACRAALVDSVDGTFLKYGPDMRWRQLCQWLDQLNAQLPMQVA